MEWINEIFNNAAKKGNDPYLALLDALQNPALSAQQKQELDRDFERLWYYDVNLVESQDSSETAGTLAEISALEPAIRRHVVDYLEAEYIADYNTPSKTGEKELIREAKKWDRNYTNPWKKDDRWRKDKIVLEYIATEKGGAAHPYIAEMVKALDALPQQLRGTFEGSIRAKLQAKKALQPKTPNGPTPRGPAA